LTESQELEALLRKKPFSPGGGGFFRRRVAYPSFEGHKVRAAEEGGEEGGGKLEEARLH